MCTLLWHGFSSGRERAECKVRHYAARRPFFFFFVVFEPRIVNPPLPLVFMQNHPFIPRHACLAAISCPPAPSPLPPLSSFPPLFPPALSQVYFNNANVLSLSLAGRPREICLSISRQPRVNQHPLTPALPGHPRHTFSPITSTISEFPPLPPRRSPLTYRYLTETRRREGGKMILISLR